jgi:hypothetical protein
MPTSYPEEVSLILPNVLNIKLDVYALGPG